MLLNFWLGLTGRLSTEYGLISRYSDIKIQKHLHCNDSVNEGHGYTHRKRITPRLLSVHQLVQFSRIFSCLETVNKRIRPRNAMTAVFRHEIKRHCLVFQVVAKLTASIDGIDPLFEMNY